jgi:hypothetical protein
VARRPARLVTIAVAMVTCLALALTGLPQVPARAAAYNPQPQQPVIQYLPHPVLVPAPTQQAAQGTTTKIPVYLICLSTADTHCVGANLDAATGEIVSSIILASGAILAPIIFRLVFGKGSTPDRGDTSAEDEGVYKGKHEQPPSEFHSCLGANPTASDGNNRVYPSSPSKCFGVLRQSWLYTIEPGTKFKYDLISRAGEHEHRVFALAQLNLRDGAFLYVKPNTQPGLWTTWSFYKIGYCTANC